MVRKHIEKKNQKTYKTFMLLKLNNKNPQPRLINKIVESLKKGGIIAYPTDTIYGIGCDIFNKRAIEKIYRLKQRNKNKPFSFICSDLKNISNYAKVSNYAYRTMKRFLPGPYTFILEGSKLVPKIMLTKRKTAGIRIPDNNICTDLINGLGNPIISTSSTNSLGEILHDPLDIYDYFSQRIDIVIDGGRVPGKPSSVISLIDDLPKVIRTGLGSIEMFEEKM